jgi:AcrR family transcriptional regulator
VPPDLEPRAYNSLKRAQAALATRRNIRASGRALFLRDGYLRTTMKAIAQEAGVSERTVFLAFPTKAALLSEIIRVAVRGDDDEQPLSARTQWRTILAAPTREVLPRLAEFNAALMARTAHVLDLGETAAGSDPALAELRDRGRQATHDQMSELAAELDARGALAPGLSVKHAADVLYALTGDQTIYLKLTEDCDWTPAQYAHMLEKILTATLIGTNGAIVDRHEAGVTAGKALPASPER